MIKTDPKWTKYILGKLEKKELSDGNPTCNGLRRVFEAEFGKILGKEVGIIKSPTMSDPCATVVCSLTYVEYSIEKTDDGELCYTKGILPEGDACVPITVQSVADAEKDHLQEPYDKHLCSTVDTRAFSRALRQAMGVDCITDDEQKVKDLAKAPISQVKVTVITSACEKLKIDIDKFLTVNAHCTSEELNQVNEAVGAELIEVLNSYQEGAKIPKEIKV